MAYLTCPALSVAQRLAKIVQAGFLHAPAHFLGHGEARENAIDAVLGHAQRVSPRSFGGTKGNPFGPAIVQVRPVSDNVVFVPDRR